MSLARKTLAYISANPETWNQENWRTANATCFAGRACILAGAEWVSDDPHNEHFQEVYPPGAEHIPANRLTARRFAAIALGYTPYGYVPLFDSTNTLVDLKELIEQRESELVAV